MAHQDVVPASGEGWSYPPFEGAIADGYIWGRGALDVKDQLFGSLEACEYLIAHGYRFKRSVYLSFGDDEETLRSGAKALAETLHSRGVRLEFLLDVRRKDRKRRGLRRVRRILFAHRRYGKGLC